MRKQFFFAAILAVFFLFISNSLATERLVPSQYATIQAAIDASINGDTVIISPGTYTGTGNRDIDFGGKAITVQSTNPEDPGVVAATIIDCNGTLSGQHRGFYFYNGEGSSSVVSGLTIIRGYTSGSPANGGGIYCNGSSPKIENCTVSSSNAYGTNGAAGGGQKGGAAYGGAICCVLSNAVINKCTIANNKSQGGCGSNDTGFGTGKAGGTAFGGGIYCDPNSNSVISNCIIGSNLAVGGNGGSGSSSGTPGDGDGGGICGKSTIKNCLIYSNGAYCGSSYDVLGNGYGGGVANNPLSISNCTIASNIAYGTYYSIAAIYGNSTVVNCIIWANDSPGLSIILGVAAITYSDVQGGYSGTGNINTNPLFATDLLGNYYLSQIAAGQAVDSPCVNAGSDTAVNLGMDDLTTRTDRIIDAGIVDMGYHYPVVFDSPDIDKNYFVNFFDFAILANNWQLSHEPEDTNNLDGDLTRNLHVDFADLSVLADAWLDCLVKPSSSPNPANNATEVDPNVILRWTAGSGALEHDVYFGTDAAAVTEANHLSAEFMDTVTDVNFDPGALDSNTTYYWRIDEAGPRCTAKGNTWNFKTKPAVFDPNLNLVGWWKFDEGSGTVANDSSGHNNNGTIYGSPARLTGPIDGALNFDGSNDHVDVPDNNSLDMTSQMTIVAWIKVNGSASFYELVTKQPSGTAGNQRPGNYEFRVQKSNGNYLPQFLHQTGLSDTEYTSYTSTSALTVGVWYHVAVTLNAGDSVRFYVNGAPAGTLLQTAVFGITNNNALKIGAVKSYDFTFLGAMDDLRIYSKALSGTEIQQIYNSGNLKANNSIPADGATNVSLTQDISWTAGYGAASHDVYFGTAASPPLVSSGQTATTYDTGTMATGTKYYWRIDEHNTGGTTIGFVWSFTTIPPPPGAASNPTPANGATSVSVT